MDQFHHKILSSYQDRQQGKMREVEMLDRQEKSIEKVWGPMKTRLHTIYVEEKSRHKIS